MNGFDVHLPSLKRVPGMFERLAYAAEKCRSYAEDAYAAMDHGIGPLRNMDTGIINQLAGTHNRIRGEVQDYFRGVRSFAAGQGGKVQETVDLYESTDRDTAEMLDASLYSPALQADVRALGRSSALDLQSPILHLPEPVDPTAPLLPPTDYRAEDAYQPSWGLPLKPQYSTDLSAARLARDIIWHATSFAAKFGFGRPYDIVNELVIPFTGDWAGLRACGDALDNLRRATHGLKGNTRWIADSIDAVWQGNAADACWLQVRKLEGGSTFGQGFEGAQHVLKLYADAYHDVVDEVQRLEGIAEATAMELLDWAITLPLTGPVGALYKLWGYVTPPDRLIQITKLVFELTELVHRAVQAVWDFNARCELGMLAAPDVSLPAVPAPSGGYS